MNNHFEFIDIPHWSNNFAALCMSLTDVHDTNYENLNKIIENYVSSCHVDLSNIGEKYISLDLYFAIKAWAAKHTEGIIAVGIVEVPNLINMKTNKPLHIGEIAYISKEKDEYTPIYYIENILANGDSKDDGVLIYIPESLNCKYSIAQPVIHIGD